MLDPCGQRETARAYFALGDIYYSLVTPKKAICDVRVWKLLSEFGNQRGRAALSLDFVTTLIAASRN